MSVKISIYKACADGEQVNVEMNMEKRHYDELEHLGSLRKVLDPYFKLVDDRLWEMNKRIVASNYTLRHMPKEAQAAIGHLMDVLHGKAGIDYDSIIKEAQAEQEKAIQEGKKKAAEFSAVANTQKEDEKLKVVPKKENVDVNDGKPIKDATS